MTRVATLDHDPPRPVRRSRWSTGRIARIAFMLLVAAAFIVPMAAFVLVPFRSVAGMADDAGGPFGLGDLSLGNLAASWSEVIAYGGDGSRGIFLRWLGNSLFVSVGGALLAVVAAIPAGYALARLRFRFRRTVLVVTLLTMVMPNTVLVIPLFLEVNAIGAVGQLWPVLLIMGFFPFGVYLSYIHFMTTMPQELVEAARIDGLGEVAVFFRVATPISRQAIALVAFFAFVANWTNFFLPLALLTSNFEAKTVSIGIQDLIGSSPLFNPTTAAGLDVKLYMPQLALATVITMIPLLVVFLGAQRFLMRGQTVGAVKG